MRLFASIARLICKPAPVAAPVMPRRVAPYVCRDRYTGRAIYRGTQADCLAYAQAFGLAYVERA